MKNKPLTSVPEAARCYNGLAYLLAFVCVLFLAMPMAGIGQTKEYATSQTNGKNSATILLGAISGGYSSTSNSSIATVDNPGRAVDADETTAATMKARNVSILVADYTGEAWLQMNFPSTSLPGANTTTYVKIDKPTTTGLSLDLLNTVGGLLGLLSENIIITEVYNGSTLINNNNVHSTIAEDGEGNVYTAVTPTQAYTGVRLKLRSQSNLLGLSLGGGLDMKVYEAFYYSDGVGCGEALLASTGRVTGLNISLGDAVTNPSNAIDGDPNTHSSISFGGLAISVASSVFQDFYFNGLSAPQDYFKVRLRLGGGSALNLNVLGNYEIRAYSGEQLVYTKKLQGALVNDLDLLGLLQQGQSVELPFAPGVPFDRVAVGINATVGASLASSPLEVYSVERYGLGDSPLTCTDPN